MSETKNRVAPTRRCSGCGEHRPKSELVRIVRMPTGEILCDLVGKCSGRGAYLCKKKQCLTLARKKRRMESALKTSIPEEVYAALEAELSE